MNQHIFKQRIKFEDWRVGLEYFENGRSLILKVDITIWIFFPTTNVSLVLAGSCLMKNLVRVTYGEDILIYEACVIKLVSLDQCISSPLAVYSNLKTVGSFTLLEAGWHFP